MICYYQITIFENNNKKVNHLFVNKDKLRELKGSTGYIKFAKQLGVDSQQLYRTLNSDTPRGGAKFLGKLKVYCNNHGLNFDDFIFLP